MVAMATTVTPLRHFVPNWTFADRLRKARHVTGMTQREFATALGQKHSRYAQWEAGNNGARDLPELANRVEALTGVSAAWLIGLQPDTPEGAPNNPCYSGGNVTYGPWQHVSSQKSAA